MRRRLDLAASLIMAPPVLFLDEPTTGLDPRGRTEVWEASAPSSRDGTTVLLTTQYLEEADQLADRISVIDPAGSSPRAPPDELKSALGGDRIDVVVARRRATWPRPPRIIGAGRRRRAAVDPRRPPRERARSATGSPR